jgi:hypothetical protein
MKIYGYEISSEAEVPLSLGEVTIASSAAELKLLASFLINVAEKIETHGSNFGHEHFSDFAGKMDTDLIVVRDSNS